MLRAAAGRPTGDPALRYPGSLEHGCVSCGSSCVGSDLGPLSDADIARLEALQPARGGWLTLVRDSSGHTDRVLRSDDGQCVNLQADRRCSVHATAGPTHKPALCRQFPLVFVRTPATVDVSLAMECRSWTRARQSGVPMADREAELRALIADGATVLDLEVPIRLCAGLAVNFEDWERLRGEMIARASAAADLTALAEAVAEPVIETVTDALASYAESEAFATRAGWGIPAPSDDLTHRAARLMETSRHVGTLLASHFAELARTETLTGRVRRADRAHLASRILREVLSGKPAAPVSRWDGEMTVWRELVLAALHGHGPARRGSVALGTALLNLRLVACHRGAGIAARAASRAAVSEQDVVDTMVLLTKMLRGTSTTGVVSHAADELVALFLLGSRVFTRGQAPRMRGMISVPGA